MTITQLQYLIAVAEHQNFTIAAEKSFVTQPTLSMQISKLEEELNVKIFDRGTKPIKLTEVGTKIVEQARKVVIEAERMQGHCIYRKGLYRRALSIRNYLYSDAYPITDVLIDICKTLS
jgi:LysR family hydrogen peroxide-inducible transcriptional activator